MIHKLIVNGMACSSCETNIIEKLSALKGVSSVSANHNDNIILIDFDENKISLTTISTEIINAGYTL